MAKIKLRTHKGATKRFKLTGTNKVARTHQMKKNNSHRNNKPSSKRGIDKSVKVLTQSNLTERVKTHLNNHK